MGERLYLAICGLIFMVIAIGHLSRVLGEWEFVLAGWVVPHWVSIPGTVVAGLLSAWGFRLASRTGARRKYHM